MNFDLPELTTETPAGALCQLKVDDLKPTQNAVGFDEVNDKIARYSAKSKEDLKDYLLVHPVPIVIGNGGNFYLTDHHHMANALWKTAEGENKAGIDTGNARVVATVQYNRHGLEGYHFCLHHTGYGDITLVEHDWRLLSGIEALNGILLVGWTTALRFLVVQRSWMIREQGRGEQ